MPRPLPRTQRDHRPLELTPRLSVCADPRKARVALSEQAGAPRIRRATMLAGGESACGGWGRVPGPPSDISVGEPAGASRRGRLIELPKKNPLLRGVQRRRGACLRDGHREWYPDESGRQVLGGTH